MQHLTNEKVENNKKIKTKKKSRMEFNQINFDS